MKKLIFLFIIGLCAFPVCAQWRTLSGWTSWSGRSGWNGLKQAAASAPRVAGNVGNAVTRVMTQTVRHSTVKHMLPSSNLEWAQNIEPASLVRQKTNLVNQQLILKNLLSSHAVRKLEFPEVDSPISAVLMVTDETNTTYLPARARVLLNNLKYENIESYLENFLLHQEVTQQRAFLYRGIHISGLQAIGNMLHHGLEVKKSHYGVICMGDLLTARMFAIDNGKVRIPVIVGVPGELLIPYLKFNRDTAIYPRVEATFPFDIPPTMFSQLLVFLEIDGKAEWYKVMPDNERMVFIPVKWLLSSKIEM